MVIAQLVGGLGNQLFQYAAARAVAHRNEVELRLDLSRFSEYPRRKPKLHLFDIPATSISSEAVACLTRRDSRRAIGRLFYLMCRGLPLAYHVSLEEEPASFDLRLLEAPGNVYLRGYWQSEKYFEDIAPILRNELVIAKAPSRTNRAIGDAIENAQAVSLHIRRGDYVSNPESYWHHGVCPLEYYMSAVEIIVDMVSRPHFFVFSDDIDWSMNNLKLPCATSFVSNNGLAHDYEDLRLMSQCKHHIIANSTFSWWGAWLGSSPEKVVIAPQQWFNPIADRSSEHLVPERWIRI